jgi:hypothetical protein
MIYLTAQPDRIKFYWQLRVQLANFMQMGINMNDVHVLVGQDLPEQSEQMKSLRDTGAQVFFYPYQKDYRYLSSVRPHIIKQHYARFPELQAEYIFYMDSDVIFNRLPNYSKLDLDGSWYVSDTRSYISADYILRDGGPTILKDMCDIVGISPDIVKAREMQSGGCQYILTGVNAAYWEKVERDCIKLFISFPNYWNPNTKKYEGINAEKYAALGEGSVQIWCADMWSVLWNAWLLGKYTFITEEMNFSWGNNLIKEFYKRPLFHLAGVTNDSQNDPHAPHFDKRIFENTVPFGTDLSNVNPQSATYPYSQLIKQVS